MSSPVSTRVESGVLVVTIERPEARNAINTVTAEAIGAAGPPRLRDCPRRGVITGAGGTFCAGMDLKAFLAGERPSIPRAWVCRGRRAAAGQAAHRGGRGYALAGGFEIALACDMVVAADNARFGLPEVKRGLVAAGAG